MARERENGASRDDTFAHPHGVEPASGFKPPTVGALTRFVVVDVRQAVGHRVSPREARQDV